MCDGLGESLGPLGFPLMWILALSELCLAVGNGGRAGRAEEDSSWKRVRRGKAEFLKVDQLHQNQNHLEHLSQCRFLVATPSESQSLVVGPKNPQFNRLSLGTHTLQYWRTAETDGETNWFIKLSLAQKYKTSKRVMNICESPGQSSSNKV